MVDRRLGSALHSLCPFCSANHQRKETRVACLLGADPRSDHLQAAPRSGSGRHRTQAGLQHQGQRLRADQQHEDSSKEHAHEVSCGFQGWKVLRSGKLKDFLRYYAHDSFSSQQCSCERIFENRHSRNQVLLAEETVQKQKGRGNPHLRLSDPAGQSHLSHRITLRLPLHHPRHQ